MFKKILSKAFLLVLIATKPAFCHDLFLPSSLKDVKVAHQYITTLLFDEPVKEVLLASKEYVVNVNKQIILLRAIKPNPGPTSIVVLFHNDKKIFNGVVSITTEPQDIYDFRVQENVEETKPDQDPNVLRKIEYLKKLPQEHFYVSIRRKYYDITLTNVFNDDKYTYLKIYIENKTSLKFDLFEANFKHFNSKKSRILVDPIFQLEDCSIPAYGSKKLIYVLPRYTTNKSGKLLISFSEQSGSRVLNLSIPARVLLKARYYGPSY